MSTSRSVAVQADGAEGAVAAAHPAATEAAAHILGLGGSAADAAIAAQAVICVVMPQAAGIGGDMMCLVHDDGSVAAVNGTGLTPANLQATPATTGGTSITVPGLVDGWLTLHRGWGRLPLTTILAQAITIAIEGYFPDPMLVSAVGQQRGRLVAGGGDAWSLLTFDGQGNALWRQPELAALLEDIALHGRDAFYSGPAAAAVVAAARRCGGSLELDDLDAHASDCPPPVAVAWGDGSVHVQPPTSQGVLLAMALQRVERLAAEDVAVDDHVLVEVTEATFAHRSSVGRGTDLLDEHLSVDVDHASHRGGPRAYLHTAGVATTDSDGQVVSSLVSVFDDFGSGVFVPELGIVLNNRAAGFTDGDNAPGPAKRPVHTLAPAILTSPTGVLGLATPGADGQVQTLLQVLNAASLYGDEPAGRTLQEAVGALRWRSQDGDLLVERGHPATDALRARGHHIVTRDPGDNVFGAVVAAGTMPTPYAVADWRRDCTTRGVT